MREPTPTRPVSLLTAGLVATTLAALAVAQDDDDEAEEAKLLGKQTYTQNCLICHDDPMVSRQRLTPKQWAAEVDKMIGWGAPVPPEEKERLVAWLTTEYPTGKPLGPAPRVEPSIALEAFLHPNQEALPDGNAANGARLYTANCANCHGPTAKGGDLGPLLVERPVLLRESDYADLMREGRRRMPGYKAVLSPADEADILAWLRERRPDEPAL